MKTNFLSFDYGKHRVEIPLHSLSDTNGRQVAVLAHSGIRVVLSPERKARVVRMKEGG